MLETERLILRRWKPTDVEPFAAMNSDPQVMEFFPASLSFKQSAEMALRIEEGFESQGFGLWTLERRDSGEFIGFTGFNRPKFESHFTPCVEIGWRLAHAHWGAGYASEAAREALRDGFERLKLAEIVSFTSLLNTRSISVMKKIGMAKDPQGDFVHPALEPGHRLGPHVLYRLSRANWLGLEQTD